MRSLLNHLVESSYGVHPIAFAYPGALNSLLQNLNRSIIGLAVDRIRVAIFAAVCKGKAGRISKRGFGAVNDFGQQCQRTDGLWAYVARSKQLLEVLRLSFVCGCWDALQRADLKWINLISVNPTWSAFALRTYKPGEERQTPR